MKKILLIASLFMSQLYAADSFVGKAAPFFDLPDQNNEFHNLNDYKGEWLVVYFYPKDNTSGCTKEAISFTKNLTEFKKLNTNIIGVSTDDVDSHKNFADEYNITFPLLADKDEIMSKEYKVLKKIPLMSYASRQTFIINPKGLIVKHYSKVSAETHASTVLDDLLKLIDNT